MPKKVLPSLRLGPLQRIVAEPITDPAEQAAIDEMRKRLRKRKTRVTIGPLKFGPLQRIIADPITDPAEQAAIDRMRKRLRFFRDGARKKWPLTGQL